MEAVLFLPDISCGLFNLMCHDNNIVIIDRSHCLFIRRTPLQRRQLNGALNRVPSDFYDLVWGILERTPGGIQVAGFLLPQVKEAEIYCSYQKYSSRSTTLSTTVKQL